MKNSFKSILFLLNVLLFVSINSYSQDKKDGNFNIKGTIKGLDKGTVKLTRYGDAEAVDSAVFQNGTFNLTGKINREEVMLITIKPGNWSTDVFVDKGIIVLNADTAGAVHRDYTKYGGNKEASLINVVFSGSDNQARYNSYMNNPERLKFNAEYVLLQKQYQAENDENKKGRLDSAINKITVEAGIWKMEWINKLIAENPNSIIGPYLLNIYYQRNQTMPLADLVTFLSKFKGAAKNSFYYESIAKDVDLRQLLTPSNVAPDFTLLKTDSTSLTLSAAKGKYILIDFWASWCKPCRNAIPHWKEVYQKYHSKDFEIISVSLDKKRSNWLSAMDEEKMPWSQVIDEYNQKGLGKTGTAYRVNCIPLYVLLDEEGKILIYLGSEEKIDTTKKLSG
ncbi:TlpA disulfide reductase family protein [Pedobacter nototheniae]|uniref:TlpA disulfide reductase family protein n=1 Tax=Pedobacter nototheniae TaxID=2488994 RepID=UPI001038ACEE|nr:TlpA disulfide reductase family protein [Pedobacter nototheniae]